MLSLLKRAFVVELTIYTAETGCNRLQKMVIFVRIIWLTSNIALDAFNLKKTASNTEDIKLLFEVRYFNNIDIIHTLGNTNTTQHTQENIDVFLLQAITNSLCRLNAHDGLIYSFLFSLI